MMPARSRRDDDGEGDEMVTLEAEELRRVTVFFLREAAERSAALAEQRQPAGIGLRLLALSQQLEELAQLLERRAT